MRDDIDSGALPVSPLRLYVLRAAYLVIALGLALMIWPLLLETTPQLEHMRGVVRALLATVGVLAVIGLRYPLQMLPLLLFELIWKTIWIVAIGLPLRAAGALEGGVAQTWFECVFGIVLCVVAIPWGYVLDHYVRRPGDPWWLQRAAVAVHDRAPGSS